MRLLLRRSPRAAAAASVAALLFVATHCAAKDGSMSVVWQGDSKINGRVVVSDEGDLRVMRFGSLSGARQTAIRRGHPELLELAYSRAVMAGLAAVAEPRRVLIVGLGGGAIPSFLRHHYPKMTIDAVDIDPVVVDAARKYFALPKDARMRVHVADGRKFVEDAKQKWDLILLDAYSADAIPRHLATVEFLTAVREHLAPGGVVVSNVWQPRFNTLYNRMRATHDAVFAEHHIVRVGAGNDLFIAFPDKRGVTHEGLAAAGRKLSKAKGFGFDLGVVVAAGWHTPPATKAEPLRDPK